MGPTELENNLFVKQMSLENGQTGMTFTEFIHENDQISMNLALFFDGVLYCGQTDTDAFQKMAKISRQDLSTFKTELRRAFMAEENDGYVFVIEDSPKQKVLLLKKLLPKEGLKVQLGRFEVDQVEFPIQFSKTFGKMFLYMKNTQDKLLQERGQLKIANEDLKIATSHLSELCTDKSRIENDLYSKFALVLNAKKSKIRDLKRQVRDLESLNMVDLIDSEKVKSKNKLDFTKDDERIENSSDLSECEDSIPKIVIPPKRTKGGSRRKNQSKGALCKQDADKTSSETKVESPEAEDLLQDL